MPVRPATSPERSGREAGDATTRERILQAGIDCFAQFGSDRVTLQDVADAAGVARNTVYRYFGDRGALLVAVATHERRLQEDEIAARTPTDATLEEAVAVVVEVAAERLLRYHTREHYRNRDRGMFTSWFLRRETSAEAHRKLLAPHVKRAAARGELREGVTQAEVLDWVVTALQGVSTVTGVRSFDPENPTAIARFYARNICRGVTRDPAGRAEPAASR